MQLTECKLGTGSRDSGTCCPARFHHCWMNRRADVFLRPFLWCSHRRGSYQVMMLLQLLIVHYSWRQVMRLKELCPFLIDAKFIKALPPAVT